MIYVTSDLHGYDLSKFLDLSTTPCSHFYEIHASLLENSMVSGEGKN